MSTDLLGRPDLLKLALDDAEISLILRGLSELHKVPEASKLREAMLRALDRKNAHTYSGDESFSIEHADLQRNLRTHPLSDEEICVFMYKLGCWVDANSRHPSFNTSSHDELSLARFVRNGKVAVAYNYVTADIFKKCAENHKLQYLFITMPKPITDKARLSHIKRAVAKATDVCNYIKTTNELPSLTKQVGLYYALLNFRRSYHGHSATAKAWPEVVDVYRSFDLMSVLEVKSLREWEVNDLDSI